jgi:hypothetical protein
MNGYVDLRAISLFVRQEYVLYTNAHLVDVDDLESLLSPYQDVIPNHSPKAFGASIYLEMPILYFVDTVFVMSMDRQACSE